MSRRRSTGKASSSRATTLISIALSTFIRETSCSGGLATNFSNVSSDQTTSPSGGFLRRTLRCFLGSSANFASALALSMTCSGACTTTYPAVSNPARPARPAICRNSRERRIRCRVPSNFASPVNSTVRIGTLMPTPSVSVPQMTTSNPDWASCSTSRR